MNDDKLKQEVASFRYGLISPIVSRQDLAPGETTALIREAVSRHYVIPGSTRTSVGERTIQRYLSMYREGGFDALMPAPRENSSRIPEELIDLAIALRRENPKRSIAAIIGMLEASGQVEPGYLKRSTLYDHFRMEQSEVKPYIVHELKMAGCDRPLFPNDVIGRIYEYSKGSIWLVARVCKGCLMDAYTHRQQPVDNDNLKRAIEELTL